jgi:hypothetical protein
VSHNEDPVKVEVGASPVRLLGVGLLLACDVGETIIDPVHRAADLASPPRAAQRLQRFDIQVPPAECVVFIDSGDDVFGQSRTRYGGDGEQATECEHEWNQNQSNDGHEGLLGSTNPVPLRKFEF